jgi:hypothetical protein
VPVSIGGRFMSERFGSFGEKDVIRKRSDCGRFSRPG